MSKRNTCGLGRGPVILAFLSLLSAAASAQFRQPEHAVSAQQQSPVKPGESDRVPPDFQIGVKAPDVNIDVSVLTSEGVFIPGLKKENFRVLEDNVSQTITSFNPMRDPITAAILAEFTNNDSVHAFDYDSLAGSWAFAQMLRKEDRVGLFSYDMKPHVLQDFTQDKRAIMGAISSMAQPGMAMSAQTNLRDALDETVDRLETLEGRKYIVLVSTGLDSSSKKTREQLLRKVQSSKDIAIYCISTGQALRNYLERRGQLKAFCPMTDVGCSNLFTQANEELTSLARASGGRCYQPQAESGFVKGFITISQTISNQYEIAYHPTNRAQDGSFRKIKVELVDGTGRPLQLRDQQGRAIPYQVVSREGYRAVEQAQ